MEVVQPQFQAEIQLVEIVFELNIGFFLNNRENYAHFVLKIIQGHSSSVHSRWRNSKIDSRDCVKAASKIR